MLLWYALMLTVLLGPVAALVSRWDRLDRAAFKAATAVRQGWTPARGWQRAKRWALALLAIVVMLPIVIPMYRATPALTIALGQAHLLEDE